MGRKKSWEELGEMIGEAGRRVEVGGLYRHSKTGGLYRVVDLALLEATEEVGVVYRAEYGEKLVWVRSLGNFLEEVEGVKRFEKVEEERP
jgi:hypothetical protein